MKAKFGEPLLLNLGGHGVRSIGGGSKRYFIIAGSYGNDGEPRAYEWDGKSSAPRLLTDIRFPGLNPEGLAFTTEEGHSEFYVVSDDGTLSIGDEDCKKLKDPKQRRFRGYVIQP